MPVKREGSTTAPASRISWRQHLVDQCRVANGKRIDKSDPVEYPAILKIFTDQNANANPPGGSPQHPIPECEPVFADRPHRLAEVGCCARFDQQNSSPAINEGRRRIWGDARLSRHHTEEFAERLKRLDTVSEADRSFDQIGGPEMTLAGRVVSGVDEDISIEADHPRSCISSRVKRRPPIGRPSRIS